MIAERRGFCPECDRYVLYRRTAPNHILHLLLSCVTLGFWLPVWFVVILIQKPFRCPNCGHAMNDVKLIASAGAVAILAMFGVYLWTLTL